MCAQNWVKLTICKETQANLGEMILISCTEIINGSSYYDDWEEHTLSPLYIMVQSSLKINRMEINGIKCYITIISKVV